MFRGETFAATAERKIRDETGNQSLAVRAVGVVGVWNTFFPDSSWDSSRRPGREGTQTVNISVFCTLSESAEVQVASGKDSSWAVQAHRWVHPHEVVSREAAGAAAGTSGEGTGKAVEDLLRPSDKFDKYVTLNVLQCYSLGYL